MTIETQVRVEPRDRVVQFYERDVDLIGAVSSYLGDSLRAGESAIVIATEIHTAAFEPALSA